MDFSYLDNLPTYNDKPNNHPNIPYPNIQIICGKTGSGKTYLLLKELCTPKYLDIEELYILSPNIQQKEYQFVKLGFQNNLSKQTMLNFSPCLDKFRTDQLKEVVELIKENDPCEKSNIKIMLTKKKEELPLIGESNANTKKALVMDDLVGEKEFIDLMKRFCSKGRPSNWQTVVLAQEFSQIPKNVRENTTCLCLFKTSGDSFDKVYKDMVKEIYENKTEFRMMCNRIWREKYSYVFINKIDEIISNDMFDSEINLINNE